MEPIEDPMEDPIEEPIDVLRLFPMEEPVPLNGPIGPNGSIGLGGGAGVGKPGMGGPMGLGFEPTTFVGFGRGLDMNILAFWTIVRIVSESSWFTLLKMI